MSNSTRPGGYDERLVVPLEASRRGAHRARVSPLVAALPLLAVVVVVAAVIGVAYTLFLGRSANDAADPLAGGPNPGPTSSAPAASAPAASASQPAASAPSHQRQHGAHAERQDRQGCGVRCLQRQRPERQWSRWQRPDGSERRRLHGRHRGPG